MSVVVLDSGILIASVFPETLTPQAAQHLIQQLQTDGVQLHAPTLLRYEIVAVSRKAVYQRFSMLIPPAANVIYPDTIPYLCYPILDNLMP